VTKETERISVFPFFLYPYVSWPGEFLWRSFFRCFLPFFIVLVLGNRTSLHLGARGFRSESASFVEEAIVATASARLLFLSGLCKLPYGIVVVGFLRIGYTELRR
jgi:hypothetical protein